MLQYVVVVEHDESGAVKSVRDGENVNLLGKVIDYGENCVVTIGGVKVYDEVNGDVFPGSYEYCIRDEFTGRGNVRVFGHLAVGVELNISINLRVHARPPVVASDEFSSLPFVWMSGKRRVMVKHDDFSLKLQVFGDIDLSMTKKEAIFEFPLHAMNYLLPFGLEIFGQLGDVFVIVFYFSNVFEDIFFLAIDKNMTLGNTTISKQL